MTVTLEQLIAAAEPRYKEAEARAPRWYPDPGTYSAAITSFEKASSRDRDGQNIVLFIVDFTLSGPGDLTNKVVREIFDTREWKGKDPNTGAERVVSFGLRDFKTLCLVLNDGEAPESLDACCDLLEASAEANQPVTLKVSEDNRGYKSASITAIGS